MSEWFIFVLQFTTANRPRMNLKHWESYYQGGALATGPAGPGGGYDRELRAAWEDFLQPLPDDATILDLGTGNGALALIIKEFGDAQGRAWRIHGTDLAQIDPASLVIDGQRRFEGVTFHAGVASEDLPFDEGAFDAVCGQYALEYADRSRAIPELARVLKPGGRAQFVVHHQQSRLAENARQSLLQGSLILQVTRVYDALRQVVVPGTETVSPDEARADFRAAMRRLGRAQSEIPGGSEVLGVTLAALRELLSMQGRYPTETLLSEIDRVERDLEFALQRVRDLRDHACGDADIDALVELADGVGLRSVERALQYHDEDQLVGWRLGWVRAAP